MKTIKTINPTEKRSSGSFYIISTLLIIVVLPVFCLLGEYYFNNERINPAHMAKWFAFWGIGVRLFTAGLSQVLRPSFTAQHILKLESPDVNVVVRELGFANICMGGLGLMTLFVPAWLPAAAFAGGLFFGMAGIQHIIKRPVSKNEIVAMLTDLWMFAMMLLYLGFLFLE